MFIKNIWYVAAWDTEVPADKPVGRIVAGEPIVLWRNSNGEIQALQDRCPHRLAPLSLGRIEGNEIRCMYHGLKFSEAGQCTHIPASDVMPANTDVRQFPVVEKDSWVWVWTGAPELANRDLIPDAWGLTSDQFVAATGTIDYEADYQLINDNLTDLSHLDFVHETTLGAATQSKWSTTHPEIEKLENGLRIKRWFPAARVNPEVDAQFESWNSYDYLMPGLFLMSANLYPEGTAASLNYRPPEAPSPMRRFEQQAVTPTLPGKSRYIFATGMPKKDAPKDADTNNAFFEIVMAAFAEDKEMIEAQQRMWNISPQDTPKAFIAQDKAPAIFRRMIEKQLSAEQTVVSQH